MKLRMKDPADLFAAVVVAALLVLTAWGNAIALLAFSAIALVVLLAARNLRGKLGSSRGRLVFAIGVAMAVGIASAFILSRTH